MRKRWGADGCYHSDGCLHCGKHEPAYCEECYQELIAENSRLQLEITKLKKEFNVESIVDFGKTIKKFGNSMEELAKNCSRNN